MVSNVKKILMPFRGCVITLCLLTVASAGLQVANALHMRDVVDAALSAPERLVEAGIRLVANLAVLVALYALTSWISGSAFDKSMASLRQAILRSVALREDETRYRHHSGGLLSRAMDDVHIVCDGVIHALPNLVGQIARLAASFGAVLLLYPSVAGYVAVAALAAVCFAALLRPLLKKHHRRVRKADEQMTACMQEDLRQLELVKSLSAEEQMLERFGKTVDNSLSAKRSRRFVTVGSNTAINGLSHLATAVMLLWGAGQVAAKAMSYGSLTAMLQLLNLLRSPVLGLSGQWTRLAAVEVAAERLQELLTESKTASCDDSLAPAEAAVFENVTFAYPGEEEPVLQNFSAEFTLDRWVCLTGVSGRGKSTLFKLLLGLYQPQQGTVSLRTAEGLIPCGPQTRKYFAYVPQDYGLFSGSVLENLLLVAPGADAGQRRKALELACAEFVFDSAEGEQTQLRENNDGLSKGQMQRIAVARAVLMERPVLLMDECTSALDAQTEKQMLQNLYSLNKQAILVTHRPEALEGFSDVCWEELKQN